MDVLRFTTLLAQKKSNASSADSLHPQSQSQSHHLPSQPLSPPSQYKRISNTVSPSPSSSSPVSASNYTLVPKQFTPHHPSADKDMPVAYEELGGVVNKSRMNASSSPAKEKERRMSLGVNRNVVNCEAVESGQSLSAVPVNIFGAKETSTQKPKYNVPFMAKLW
ncbi:hypothetical protein BKA69DRAFT_1041225 [Paraphysoderma sedebokerense]|nr:hypothetical protein BKA69DRAFT_1041225 [Paraphysoderma sedebokerense]